MKVKQFVMAYAVDQDKLRACIPVGFQSLRPVLRINAEVRGTQPQSLYLEFNTPVGGHGKRGWLNIAHWDDPELSCQEKGNTTVFQLPNLTISFTGVGIQDGCPAEGDDQGCFFLGKENLFRFSESIGSNKEFCNCEFTWHHPDGDVHGVSLGKTLPAFFTPPQKQYPSCHLSSAMSIPCKEVLGSYQVAFERNTERIEPLLG